MRKQEPGRASAEESLSFFRQELESHRATIEATARDLAGAFLQMLELWETCVRAGGKLLFFGNGGSAADAQHIAAELVAHRQLDRAPVPALALTTDSSVLTACANDFGHDSVFSRQLEALGRPGDLAVGISTSGTSANVLAGLEKARRLKLATAGFTGQRKGRMPELCDALLVVPSAVTERIQETHITLAHVLCAALQRRLRLVGG
jgi:D-sedoheptulose 7-phosphate isomerase